MSDERSFKRKAPKVTGLTVRFSLSVLREARVGRSSEADDRSKGTILGLALGSALRAISLGATFVKLVTWLLGTVHPSFFYRDFHVFRQ